MINTALSFLKSSLNTHLQMGSLAANQQEDSVVFLSSGIDSIGFKSGAVTMLLVRLAQENILREPDLYSRTMADGSIQNTSPEIRLELFVLCVANYPQYEDSLKILSAVIGYFQNNRLIMHDNSPALSDDIDQLVIELVQLSFAEQNEVWNSLRTSYHPSVLYKIKMIAYQGATMEDSPLVKEKNIGVQG